MRAAAISANRLSSTRIGTRLCSLWVDTMTSCRMRTSSKNLKPFKMKRLLTCITLMIHMTRLCLSNVSPLTFKINTKLSRRRLSIVQVMEWPHLVAGKLLQLVVTTILLRATLLHLLPSIQTIYQMLKLMLVPGKCRQLLDKMLFSVSSQWMISRAFETRFTRRFETRLTKTLRVRRRKIMVVH